VAAAVRDLRAAAEDRARRAELDRVGADGERRQAEVRAAEERKRRRVVLAAAGAVAAVLAAGAGVSAWQMVRANGEADRATGEATNARFAEGKAREEERRAKDAEGKARDAEAAARAAEARAVAREKEEQQARETAGRSPSTCSRYSLRAAPRARRP
jgi:hypothetical protein